MLFAAQILPCLPVFYSVFAQKTRIRDIYAASCTNT
jgi:hypothetical protein